MRFAAIVALAVFGASCAGSDDASDRPRNSAADSAFHADSAILAAIVERDAAEQRRGAGTQTSGGFAPYTGGGPTAPPTFSRTDPAPAATPAIAAAGVRAVNTYEAAHHMRGNKGRVTLAILYGTRCPRSQAMFPGFVALAHHYEGQAFDVAAFSMDEPEDKDAVPGFLARYHAPFDPLYVKPWQPGALFDALIPLGFHIPTPWNLPYVAVLDSQGSVVAEWDGATNLAAVDAAIQSQLAR